jgi:hypothetical protein
VRGQNDAVPSYDKKIAAILAALCQELLFSIAIVIYLFEIRQRVPAAAWND